MDILGGITAATEGIKLVNELRKIDNEVDKADLKIRLVDLADKLLDSKQALQDAQEERLELLRQVAKLEEDIRFKAKLRDENGLLFQLNERGDVWGSPYCNQCYVKEDKLFRLLYGPYTIGPYKCSNCTKFYGPVSPSDFSY